MTTPSTPTAAPAAAPVAAAPAAPAAPAAAPAAPAAPAAAPKIDSLIPDNPAAAPAPAASPAATDPNAANAWLFAEGVLGAGERPTWFKADKYKSVADQAAAYPDLEKRFGSFVGAPKDGKYDIAIPAEIGLELDGEHPLLGTFQKWGAENHLSQKGFTELMGMLAQYEAQNMVDMDAVKKDLGEKADDRIGAVAQWGKANLDAEGYSLLRQATAGPNAAAVFKVLESVIGKTRQVALPKPGSDVLSAQPQGLQAIQAEHSKRGADGKLLYDTDPKHRARIEAAYQEYYAKAG